MAKGRLQDRKVLVVGASSGIGQASGQAIAAEGGRVAFAARRVALLEEAVAAAGAGSVALACDVCDPASCEQAVDQAAEALGGLDALVYTPGVTLYNDIQDMDADAWRLTLDTNVIGASLVMSQALPHLEKVRGKAVFFSSISIDDQPPRRGMAPYVVSKTALETLVRAWQGEHQSVGFTTIAMGDTLSGKVGESNNSRLPDYVQGWIEKGYMYGRLMEAESVAAQVVNVLSSPETVRRLAITPQYADADTVMESVFVSEDA